MKKGMIIWITMMMIMGMFAGAIQAEEKDKLVFGAIAVGKVSKVKKSLTPLINCLKEKTGKEIVFETGRDYPDTIAKFQSGYFDFGYIGPSPYIIATSGPQGASVFNILAGIETNHLPYFYAVIVAAKENDKIQTVEDIKGKKFAFGSRQSTLSFYMPCKMLMDAGVYDTLAEKQFLGKHDKVVRDVALGGYDAGGVKIAVAEKHKDKVKIIAKSEPVYDFLMVAHHTLPSVLQDQLKKALLELKDPEILNAVKKGVTGFVETEDSRYDSLRKVMAEVDQKVPQ